MTVIGGIFSNHSVTVNVAVGAIIVAIVVIVIVDNWTSADAANRSDGR